jgi:hypothetical protein
VAKQIREKYPQVYTDYKKMVDEYTIEIDLRRELLGKINPVEVGEDLYVVNMFGQLNYGYDGYKYTNETALYSCFKQIRKRAEKYGLPVSMPYMVGGYRGGGDWKLIEDYLLNAFDGYEVTLYKYNEG